MNKPSTYRSSHRLSTQNISIFIPDLMKGSVDGFTY